jgi:hypothetical protein
MHEIPIISPQSSITAARDAHVPPALSAHSFTSIVHTYYGLFIRRRYASAYCWYIVMKCTHDMHDMQNIGSLVSTDEYSTRDASMIVGTLHFLKSVGGRNIPQLSILLVCTASR